MTTTVEVIPLYSKGDTRPPWQLYVQSPLEYYGATTTDELKTIALQRAYEAGQPVFYPDETRLRVTVPLDLAVTPTQRWAVLKAARDWQAASYGKIDLQFPDGLNRVLGDSIIANGGENEFSMTSAGTPTTVIISSITYAAPLVTNRPRVTITCPALPTYVVPGYPIGTQAPTGDNDAAAITGGLIVETISGDRTSFTASFWFSRLASDATGNVYTLTSPTTITSSPNVNGVPISRLVVPRSVIGFEGGWVGGTTEGAICARTGGSVRTANMGFVYLGTALSSGCTAFIKDPNSKWDSVRDVFVGGPEKTIRIATDGKFTAFLSCFGGGNQGGYVGSGTNAETINAQEGGKVWLVRCSVGGAKTLTVTAANNAYLDVNQSFVSGGQSGVRVSTNSQAEVLATRITHSQRGLYALRGSINLSTTTSVSRCYVDLAWLAGGFIYDTPVRTENYISAMGQTLDSGGGWYANVLKGLTDGGLGVTAAPKDGGGLGGYMEAPVQGSGEIEILGSNPNLMGTVRFTANYPTATSAVGIDMGSTFVVQTTEPTTSSNDGFVTVAIYTKAGATYIGIVNRTTASASLRLYVRGNVQLGDFVQLWP